ncbi:MAG: hypothetical protein LBI96_01495 [Odoribacteraceae bacterium]|nr:hypothetical protein [Odoribacteraceae bacterium]
MRENRAFSQRGLLSSRGNRLSLVEKLLSSRGIIITLTVIWFDISTFTSRTFYFKGEG